MLTVDFRRLALRPGHLALDSGCGEGRHVFEFFRRNGVVLGMDLSRTSLRKAHYILKAMKPQADARRYLLLQGDALCYPFRSETFDRIICAEVLEHVPSMAAAALEIARILKKGGRLAVTVPTVLTEHIYDRLSPEYFRTPGGHVRKVNPRALAGLLEKHHLRVYAVGFAHSFHSPYWMLRCLSGLHDEQSLLPRLYRRFLHLSLYSKPLLRAERIGNLFFPKSIILYAQKYAP